MEEKGSYTKEIERALEAHISDELYGELLEVLTENTPVKMFDVPYRKRRDIINGLRRVFAKISIDMLEPRLVIMDEFQRYKDLIAMDDVDADIITDEFLRDNSTKVLLLSATPYRPYTTLDEIAAEDCDHHTEFIGVMNFLLQDNERNATFREVWRDYSHHLSEIATDALTVIHMSKIKAESALYQCICRTERRNDNILNTDKAKPMTVSKDDIASYIDIQKLLDDLELGNFPIEYVKSAPYLLSFMNYDIKRKIVRELTSRINDNRGFSNTKTSMTLLLRKSIINDYAPIPTNNSRLDLLFDEAFGADRKSESKGNGAELMLWIPASMPYYKTRSVFHRNTGYSKTLVFSGWEMVPRMIASLTSYESERRTIGRLPERIHLGKRTYYAVDEKSRSVVVRLREGADDLIKYPSGFLAKLFKPEDHIGRNVDIKTIRNELAKVIRRNINDVAQSYRITVRGKQGGAKQLLQLLKALDGIDVRGELNFIPEYAAELFAYMAIGAPAVCALRLFGDKKLAEKLAKYFISLFNKPESIAAIDVYSKEGEGSYYKDVIRYCAEGNLQAVLDEFYFILDPSCDSAPSEICEAMCSAFIGSRSIKIDAIQRGKDWFSEEKKISIRTHFAVGYYNIKGTDNKLSSTENVRAAFNSPFRPFVLATTSIGQEGLDFHQYCRKIMHWNLPYNAIDLEQREGRINRYLCHAIRQNLANSEYADPPCRKNVWREIMNRAEAGLKKEGSSDLVPYWQLPKDYIYTHQIERIVPMYPFSRDVMRYERMIEVLSLYRLTLGQPRQEELLKVIQNQNLSKENLSDLFINLSPFDKVLTEINAPYKYV